MLLLPFSGSRPSPRPTRSSRPGVEATCEGFTVAVTPALGTTCSRFLDYQIDVDPAAPGTPIARSLPVQGDASSMLVTATETVVFPSPLTGTFAVGGTVALRSTTSQLAVADG